MRKQAPSGHTNLPTHFIKSYTKMIYCLPMFHVLLIYIYILHYVTLTVKFNEGAWPDKCRRIIGTLDGFCSLGFCSAALTAYRNPNITLVIGLYRDVWFSAFVAFRPLECNGVFAINVYSRRKITLKYNSGRRCWIKYDQWRVCRNGGRRRAQRY